VSARAIARDIARRLEGVSGDEAKIEAEVLVRHATGLSRAEFYRGAAADASAIEQLAERRLAGEPTAYITGRREFYGIEFAVSPAVLIPRPETELLVELALGELAARPAATVLDVGTGSGCIAVAIATQRSRQGPTVMSDVSRAALEVARRNAARHGAECGAVQAHLAGAVAAADIVVSNLPYICSSEIAGLAPEIREWEPRLALDGGPDGLRLVRELIDDCGQRLRPGAILLEVGMGQAHQVAAMLSAAGAGQIRLHRDLAAVDRVVAGHWAA
jgi:release factor glutamine methyltransferase